MAEVTSFQLVTVEDLFREHWSRLVGLAVHLGASHADAQDAVSDVFEWALGSYDVLATRSARALLSAVLKNRLSTMRRAKSPLLLGDLVVDGWDGLLAEPEPTEPVNAGLCTGDLDTVLYVMAALEELPERHRRALELWALEGLSMTEVGERLGMARKQVNDLVKNSLVSLARRAGRE